LVANCKNIFSPPPEFLPASVGCAMVKIQAFLLAMQTKGIEPSTY
jgi:hypothetical protein